MRLESQMWSGWLGWHDGALRKRTGRDAWAFAFAGRSQGPHVPDRAAIDRNCQRRVGPVPADV